GLTAGYGPDSIAPGQSPKGTLLTNQYATAGIIFSADTHAVAYVTSTTLVGGLVSPAGGNILAVNTVPDRNNPPAVLTASFVDTATGAPGTVDATTFSVFVSDSNDTPDPRVIVRTFGADGGFLEEQDLHSLGTTLRLSVGRIATVEFIDNGGDGHTISGFSFGRVLPTNVTVTVTVSDGR